MLWPSSESAKLPSTKTGADLIYWKINLSRFSRFKIEGRRLASLSNAGLGVFTVVLSNKQRLTVLQMAPKPLATFLKIPELELLEYLLQQ